MMNRTEIAQTLFIEIMGRAEGLGGESKETLQEVYKQVADMCLNMAEAFEKTAAARRYETV